MARFPQACERYRMQTLQTGTILSDGGRDGKIDAPSGEFSLNFAVESADPAATPEHLFAGAYAACFHSALKSAGKRDGLDLNGSTVICSVHLNEENSNASSLSVELRAAIPGVDAIKGEQLLQQAHRSCPYSKAVRNNIPVKVSLD